MSNKKCLLWKCKCGETLEYRKRRFHMRRCKYYNNMKCNFIAKDIYSITKTEQMPYLIEIINITTGIDCSDIEKAFKYADKSMSVRLN